MHLFQGDATRSVPGMPAHEAANQTNIRGRAQPNGTTTHGGRHQRPAFATQSSRQNNTNLINAAKLLLTTRHFLRACVFPLTVRLSCPFIAFNMHKRCGEKSFVSKCARRRCSHRITLALPTFISVTFSFFIFHEILLPGIFHGRSHAHG